jgi:hypothetical protein
MIQLTRYASLLIASRLSPVTRHLFDKDISGANGWLVHLLQPMSFRPKVGSARVIPRDTIIQTIAFP